MTRKASQKMNPNKTPEPSDEGEMSPDETFHFRQSFSKGTQRSWGWATLQTPAACR